jgi:hypothetical protein
MSKQRVNLAIPRVVSRNINVIRNSLPETYYALSQYQTLLLCFRHQYEAYRSYMSSCLNSSAVKGRIRSRVCVQLRSRLRMMEKGNSQGATEPDSQGIPNTSPWR